MALGFDRSLAISRAQDTERLAVSPTCGVDRPEVRQRVAARRVAKAPKDLDRPLRQ